MCFWGKKRQQKKELLEYVKEKPLWIVGDITTIVVILLLATAWVVPPLAMKGIGGPDGKKKPVR